MAEGWDELMDRVERAHGVVTSTDLIAAGLSKGQIRRLASDGRLVSIGHGAWRIRGAPDTRAARVLGAVAGLEGEVWASHRTAAWLLDVPFHSPPGLIEVTRTTGVSAQRSGLLIHRSTWVPEHHTTVVRSIPTLTVPRTVFDLARLAGQRQLDRLIERVLRDDRCTVGALHRVLAEIGGRGRPGTRKMRIALSTRDSDYIPTASELEAVGRSVLGSIPGIEWEVEMSDEQGYIRRVDGLVRHAGVVIEMDGHRFHREPSVVALDADGDRRLVAMGYVVERCDWLDLTRRPEVVVARVLRLVAGAAS